ncbi:MAG: Tm-1-like ATP-binding domain-containing protein [Pirellulales bacterium]
MLTIAVVGTLDTKLAECEFTAAQIRDAHCRPLLIDVGTTCASASADISREEVLSAAGTSHVSFPDDRGSAVATMTELIARAMPVLASRHQIAGVISLGGTGYS